VPEIPCNITRRANFLIDGSPLPLNKPGKREIMHNLGLKGSHRVEYYNLERLTQKKGGPAKKKQIPRSERGLPDHPMTRHPMTVRSPMSGDPKRMVRPWAWRVGMDHCGTRSKEEKDKNEEYCFWHD